MMEKILIVDDEAAIGKSLGFALRDKYDVTAVTSQEEALQVLAHQQFDLCLLDLKIGMHSGLDLLGRIKEMDKAMVVIIITAFGSIETTVEAIKKGAYTYLTKPLNLNELHLAIAQALEHRMLNQKVEYLSRELEQKYSRNGIIGKSAEMQDVFRLIDRLCNVDTSVVIMGESGTGKELVARAIHYSGQRKARRFVEINCAAIPEGLLEEELFGHKKGSFTGAISDKEGKFEYADGGTIFLDEIGEMPYALQAKLLRVLQQQEYTPIGGNQPVKLDVRVIAATNRDLREMVDRGSFRQDLYFRLNVVQLAIPPLRQRKVDLPLLFAHFLKSCGDEFGKTVKGLSRAAERALLDYDYPGNVRELANILEYAVLMTETDLIELHDLPKGLRQAAEPDAGRTAEHDIGSLTLREIEKKAIEAALLKNGGHIKTTAAQLGISDKGLRNKITEYDITQTK